MTSDTGLVHLVWKPLGLERFEAFLTSYKMYETGVPHDLIIIFKGFEEKGSLAPFQAALENIPHRPLFYPERGFDIMPYFHAARRLEYKYFCFLNSYSIILDDGWLKKMHDYITRDDVGLTGATSGYESFYTTLLRETEGEGPSRLSPRKAMAYLYHRAPNELITHWLEKRRKRRRLTQLKSRFDPFPNPVIRTNGFMIRRDLMLKLEYGPERSKMDTFIFESGKRSMTRQIEAMGKHALVVGRDGQAYEKERWHESRTFRSGDQSNLLIADNRTRQYMEADPETKRYLSEICWGR